MAESLTYIASITFSIGSQRITRGETIEIMLDRSRYRCAKGGMWRTWSEDIQHAFDNGSLMPLPAEPALPKALTPAEVSKADKVVTALLKKPDLAATVMARLIQVLGAPPCPTCSAPDTVVLVTCTDCKGMGAIPDGSDYLNCNACGNSGKVPAKSLGPWKLDDHEENWNRHDTDGKIVGEIASTIDNRWQAHHTQKSYRTTFEAKADEDRYLMAHGYGHLP